jgi:hypothetical protein
MNEPLELHILQSGGAPIEWSVEAIDPADGAIYQAIFIGPEAEKRAREYAAWKYPTLASAPPSRPRTR